MHLPEALTAGSAWSGRKAQKGDAVRHPLRFLSAVVALVRAAVTFVIAALAAGVTVALIRTLIALICVLIGALVALVRVLIGALVALVRILVGTAVALIVRVLVVLIGTLVCVSHPCYLLSMLLLVSSYRDSMPQFL